MVAERVLVVSDNSKVTTEEQKEDLWLSVLGTTREEMVYYIDRLLAMI